MSHPNVRKLLCVCALALAGCSEKPPINPPPLPALDVKLPLPKLANGNFLLIEASRARIEIDPTTSDALTALGACTDLVTYCVEATGADVPECSKAAKTCASDTPWTEKSACCPKACKDALADAAKGGEDEVDAFERIYFLQPDCFPGVRAALEAP